MDSINAGQQTPAGEDASASPPPAPVVMDPSLLMAASMGDCEALKNLLNWGDAPVWPEAVAVAPQEVVVDVANGDTLNVSITNGSLDVPQQASAGAIEEGAGDQPVAPSAESLLEGVTTLGDTALHVLAKSGYSSMENFLDSVYVVYNKAKHLLDKPNMLGDMPLHCASRAASCKMVYCLLELAKGEEDCIDRVKSIIRKQNMRGETALHEAIRARNIDIVILLMMEDSQLARVPSEGISPLFLAVVLGQYHIASILHEKDNQLSYSGPDGKNVLHASLLRNLEISEVLLGWNNDLAKKQCHNGSTPLHLLSMVSDGAIMIPILLEANSYAAYQSDRSGSFPIHIAASRNGLKAIISLLKRCPECVNLCDAMGRTFLHIAVEKKSYTVVSYACGTPSVAAILNAQDNDGNTALHLAVQAGDLKMVCSLLKEQKIQLSIPNNSGQTPRHLAWFRLPRGLYFYWNPEVMIHKYLGYAGARYGCYGAGLVDERHTSQLDNDRESEIIKDSTQILGIGSVLIATVAFGATFALPGGYRADDHSNGGTPTLVGRYAFHAYIIATTIAFVCASVATTGLMFSGMAMVDLALRRKQFQLSVGFAASSVTSLGASFALGLYLVLEPVAHNTAIAVLVIFAAMLIGVMEPLQAMKIVGALHIRLGKGIWRIVIKQILMLSFVFWPFVIIFIWPTYSTKYRGN